MRYRKYKLILIVLMICGISYLHYAAKLHQPLLHLIHRELYLVPIILSAYWFGKRIGLSVSIIASILFLPWTLMMTPGETAYHVINVLHVVMFNVIAYIVGIYHDARASHFGLGKSKTAILEGALPSRGRNVLLCIDGSPNALKAARYVAGTFNSTNEIAVTVLGILQQPSGDFYESEKAWQRAKEENQVRVSSLMEKARSILREGGISPESIEVSTLLVQKKSISEKIMEQQRRNKFDTIVVGAVKMSKAQEFLFGNTGVKLVREAECPVIVVN
jgi:nucleotide-binding universal stress UspA family protein